MLVVCAWCESETGEKRVLRTVRPFDDDSETHSACDRHAVTLLTQLLKQRQASGELGLQLLFVVAGHRPDVHSWLSTTTSDDPDIRVIYDRRGDSRPAKDPAPLVTNRRRRERGGVLEAHLAEIGWAAIICPK